MTSCEKNDSLLRAFGLPAGGEGAADEVRGVLSRLLASRALRLADLQTARDIAERAGVTAPESYLFLAAMFVSSGKGNAFMRDSDVEALLVAGGYLDDPMKLALLDAVRRGVEDGSGERRPGAGRRALVLSAGPERRRRSERGAEGVCICREARLHQRGPAQPGGAVQL